MEYKYYFIYLFLMALNAIILISKNNGEIKHTTKDSLLEIMSYLLLFGLIKISFRIMIKKIYVIGSIIGGINDNRKNN